MIGKEIGPYRILEKIGQGGMGVVYRGVHAKIDQEVAIKVLSPEYAHDQSMRKRFITEAKIQVKLSHPNVVNTINYLEDKGDIFLVMEYVSGETLEQRLNRVSSLPIERATTICLSVLEALSFMHSKGIVHRDIKPSNIMFTGTGTVKVTDFGIAKIKGEKGQTKTGMRIGTVLYMSPEQIKGQEADVASDIYSTGITFYQMVTGRVPFNGMSEYAVMKGHLEETPPVPWDLNNKVPKELGNIILKSIAKDPADRYGNTREFSEELRNALNLQKEDFSSSPAPKTAPLMPFLQLSTVQSVTALAGLGIILLTVAALVFFSGGKQETNSFPFSVISPPDALSINAEPSIITVNQPVSSISTETPVKAVTPERRPKSSSGSNVAVVPKTISGLPAQQTTVQFGTIRRIGEAKESSVPVQTVPPKSGGWKIKK